MRVKLFLFCSGFACLNLFAGALTLDSRFEIQNTGRDQAAYTGILQPPISQPWQLKLGARISHSLQDLERVQYGAEISYSLFSFFQPVLRVSTDHFLNSTTAQSHVLMLISSTATPFDFLTLIFQGGWYRRYVKINKPYFLTSFIGPSYTQHDFAVNVGANLRWSDQISSQFNVATFEELTVFNLNNPFIQGMLSLTSDSNQTVWALYTRYRLLLGFGRMNSLTFGLNFTQNY